MYENQTAGTQNGETTRDTAAHAAERLRAKAGAAGEAVRERAQHARGWARMQLDGLQHRVEAEPYRASAWALGIGFIAGVVLTALIGNSRR